MATRTPDWAERKVIKVMNDGHGHGPDPSTLSGRLAKLLRAERRRAERAIRKIALQYGRATNIHAVYKRGALRACDDCLWAVRGELG